MTWKIVEGIFTNKDIIHNWFYSTIIISRRQQGPNTNSNHPIITLWVINQKVPQKYIRVLHMLKYPNINSNYLYVITKWSMKVNYAIHGSTIWFLLYNRIYGRKHSKLNHPRMTLWGVIQKVTWEDTWVLLYGNSYQT